jgi:phosphoribosyl 1,2-cyclic phosphodiesterase
LDAGTGIRRVTGLLDGEAFTGTLLLTHLHWDHVQGLPFFSGGDRADAMVTCRIPSQPGRADAHEVLARCMSPPHFPIRPNQLRGAWMFGEVDEGRVEIEGFSIEAREVPHKGGRTFGYRVSDGQHSLAYIPDHCPTLLGAGRDGFGEYYPGAIDLATDTDLLLHDSHLVASELPDEAAFGHAAAEYGLGLAKVAGARRVILFHHKPDRTDDGVDRIVETFGDSPVPVAGAEEGSTIEL